MCELNYRPSLKVTKGAGNNWKGTQCSGTEQSSDGSATHCIPYQLSSCRDRARTQSQVECTLKLHGQRSPKIRKQWPQFQRFVRTSSVPWRERENSSPFPPMLKSLLNPAIRLAALWVNEAFCFRKEVKLQDLSFHCFDQSLLTLGILCQYRENEAGYRLYMGSKY